MLGMELLTLGFGPWPSHKWKLQLQSDNRTVLKDYLELDARIGTRMTAAVSTFCLLRFQ